MRRLHLIKAIYDNSEDWSCPGVCPSHLEEDGTKDVCMKCAEEMLSEYEHQIREETIKKIYDEIVCVENEYRSMLVNTSQEDDMFGLLDLSGRVMATTRIKFLVKDMIGE